MINDLTNVRKRLKIRARRSNGQCEICTDSSAERTKIKGRDLMLCDNCVCDGDPSIIGDYLDELSELGI